MDWSKGYSSFTYMTLVDRATWQDTSRIEITGGNIERSLDDLLQSADIDCTDYDENSERLIRVWLDARQIGGLGHTPLFTGWASSPSISINGVVVSHSLQCYSVLKPAQDILLSRGWYAPIDINGGALIRRLLSATGAPIDIYPQDAEAKTLQNAIVAEDGENNLSMAWSIADAIGWTIRVDGFGRIQIGPIDATSKWRFGMNEDDIIEPSLTIERDWYNCPNVFRANANEMSAVAREDDPDSMLSTVSRGREIWAEENDCDLAEDENLSNYAVRQLRELQNLAVTVGYDRRYVPDIYPGDVVTLNYPKQNLLGDYMVKTQSIDLGYGAKTSEEVNAL